jgi:phosphatidylserine decarboxylase
LPERLTQSLQKARDLAAAELKPELFAALDWPTDLGQYEEYLKRHIRWVPYESTGSARKNQNRQTQEVGDRIAHFYC